MTRTAAPISSLVPMIHVADVERSVEFYRRLGFEVGNRQPESGPMHWAWLFSPTVENWKRGPNLMLVRTSCPMGDHEQEALFYLYASDLVALRDELLAAGVDAGEIDHPEYLQKGEFRVLDPDGYTLMIAQTTESTP